MTEPALPLPPPYTAETVSEYADALIGFEREYRCIAKFYSQHIFTKGLPVDWAPKYDAETWLSIIAGEVPDETLPEPLTRFMRLARELPLVGIGPKLESLVVQKNRKKFTPKKSYEVDVLVKFVKETTEQCNIKADRVVDVGAGLGYLSQELAKSGFQVTAIEGDPERAEKVADGADIECIAKIVNGPDDLDVTPDPCIAVSLRMPPPKIIIDSRCLWRPFFTHNPLLSSARKCQTTCKHRMLLSSAFQRYEQPQCVR